MPKRQNKAISLLHGYKVKNNLTYAELAEEMGIRSKSLNAWILGRTVPNSKSIDKVRAFLKSKEVKEPRRTKAEIEKEQTMRTEVTGIDSRTVAEWTDKNHKDLLRDIKRYDGYLKSAKLRPTDFWQETSYTSQNGKVNPCYFITRKGCEFIQHKMTGEKGAIFTARYINYFHEQGEQLQEATQLLLDIAEETPAPQEQAPAVDVESAYINSLLQEAIDETDKRQKFAKVIKARILVETINKFND